MRSPPRAHLHLKRSCRVPMATVAANKMTRFQSIRRKTSCSALSYYHFRCAATAIAAAAAAATAHANNWNALLTWHSQTLVLSLQQFSKFAHTRSATAPPYKERTPAVYLCRSRNAIVHRFDPSASTARGWRAAPLEAFAVGIAA